MLNTKVLSLTNPGIIVAAFGVPSSLVVETTTAAALLALFFKISFTFASSHELC